MESETVEYPSNSRCCTRDRHALPPSTRLVAVLKSGADHVECPPDVTPSPRDRHALPPSVKLAAEAHLHARDPRDFSLVHQYSRVTADEVLGIDHTEWVADAVDNPAVTVQWIEKIGEESDAESGVGTVTKTDRKSIVAKYLTSRRQSHVDKPSQSGNFLRRLSGACERIRRSRQDSAGYVPLPDQQDASESTNSESSVKPREQMCSSPPSTFSSTDYAAATGTSFDGHGRVML